MAANEFNLPCSLLKMAYNACNDTHRKWYDEMPTLPVDLQICCKSLLRVMELNSDVERFRPLEDRRSMFAKVQSIAQSKFGDGCITENLFETAASHGHIDCMKFARAIGVPWSTTTKKYESACDMAAKSGHLECLAYAHVNGVNLTADTSIHAAKGGHLDCLIYLHNNGCPWHLHTCTVAAEYGHIECLTYARQNGCPWNKFASTMAVMKGQVECIKYCRENGCPWDDSLLNVHKHFGNPEFVKYVTENGCRLNENSSPLAVEFERRTRLKHGNELEGKIEYTFFHARNISIAHVRVMSDTPRRGTEH